jgi:hypothetical protein
MAKQRWEVEAVDRFLRFLQERGQDYVVTGEDVVTNPLTSRNYDFELTANTQNSPVIALEIFRLAGDEQDLARHRAWNDIAHRLGNELKARNVAGYLIRTPPFNVPKSRRNQFVSDTADKLVTAIANSADQQEFAADGYEFHKLPDDAPVRLSSIGGIRAINPFASASDALDDLLPTKNEQLNTQGRLRTLLILNAGIFPQEERDIRQYFSIRNMEEFPNVDRTFFETAAGKVALVFDRQVFDCYRNARLPDDDELAGLFFSFVGHRLLARDRKAFEISTMIGDRYGSLDRLSIDGRDALISCGEMFVEEEEWPPVLWIIEQLKNDSDPPFPNPMHERVAEGKDSLLISSVRGRLCWLIQKIVVHNLIEHYPSMLDILERYASGADFYIRSQACVPLSEMAVRRRQRLPGGSRFMPESIAARIKAIALRMLRSAGTNPAMLDDVSNVLGWIADLSEDEADEVVERLAAVGDHGVHNRCGILLYYALLREDKLPDLPRFDPARFKSRLEQDLIKGESRFRTSLMWQMAGGAEERAYPYQVIRPYLPLFVSGQYNAGAFLHLRRICAAHIVNAPEEICRVILMAIEKAAEYIAAEPRSRAWQVYDLQEFFDLLTEKCPELCVLDGVALMLTYKPRIPGISGRAIARILSKYESARAEELKTRYADELNA